jgi:hypothetical protein
MMKSEHFGKLMEALAKAQVKLENPVFDKVNPHFKNKYASLAAIRDAVIPTLAAEGLTLTQWLSSGENSLKCETMISHSSGEWISETLELPVSKHDAQGFASAATYARRIGMQSAAGVTGDEDDDAEAAVKPTRTGTTRPAGNLSAAAGASERVTNGQLQQIDQLASGVVDAFTAKNPDLAYAKYLDAQTALKAYGADAQVLLRDKFDSTQRSTLQKYYEADREKKMAAMYGQQA